MFRGYQQRRKVDTGDRFCDSNRHKDREEEKELLTVCVVNEWFMNFMFLSYSLFHFLSIDGDSKYNDIYEICC